MVTPPAPYFPSRFGRSRERRAFALIEALAASVVLGLGLVAVMGLTARAIAAQTRGERLAIAAMLADERLNLVLATGIEGYESSFALRGRCEEPFEDYSYEVVINEGSAGDPAFVIAEIYWKSGGRDQSISVETLIAPRLGDDPDPDRRPDETVDRSE